MKTHRCVATALVIATFAFHGNAEDRLDQVIANVMENEGLYANIDVTMRQVRQSARHRPSASNLAVREVMFRDQSVHWVHQGERFRLEMKGDSYSGYGAKNRDRIRAFDGKTTRLFDQGAVGNIIRGPSWDSNAIRPHMLLMRYSSHGFPLSTLLKGDEAIANHPAGQPQREGLQRRIEYTREDTFKDLHCHVVTVSTYNLRSKSVSSRREYWLAETRNYLPIRLLSYSSRGSNDVAGGEGVVDRLRELHPGIWFPEKAHFTSYDKLSLKSTGRQKRSWEDSYEIKAVSLNPMYDAEFFSRVEFPVGAAVYELEGGEIKRSYRVRPKSVAETTTEEVAD
ncbi:MAG: hypothetical protein AAF989_00120 [Planctomycetota bacterium]